MLPCDCETHPPDQTEDDDRDVRDGRRGLIFLSTLHCHRDKPFHTVCQQQQLPSEHSECLFEINEYKENTR